MIAGMSIMKPKLRWSNFEIKLQIHHIKDHRFKNKGKINDIEFQSSAMLDGISPLQKRIFLSREGLAGYFKG